MIIHARPRLRFPIVTRPSSKDTNPKTLPYQARWCKSDASANTKTRRRPVNPANSGASEEDGWELPQSVVKSHHKVSFTKVKWHNFSGGTRLWPTSSCLLRRYLQLESRASRYLIYQQVPDKISNFVPVPAGLHSSRQRDLRLFTGRLLVAGGPADLLPCPQ